MQTSEKENMIKEATAKIEQVEDLSGYSVCSFWTLAEVNELNNWLNACLANKSYNNPQTIVVTTNHLKSREGKHIKTTNAFTLTVVDNAELIVWVHQNYLDRI